jgi:hypothetical protein
MDLSSIKRSLQNYAESSKFSFTFRFGPRPGILKDEGQYKKENTTTKQSGGIMEEIRMKKAMKNKKKNKNEQNEADNEEHLLKDEDKFPLYVILLESQESRQKNQDLHAEAIKSARKQYEDMLNRQQIHHEVLYSYEYQTLENQGKLQSYDQYSMKQVYESLLEHEISK